MIVRLLNNRFISAKWMAVIITDILATVLCLICIYGFGDYGQALFVLLPLLMGMCSVVLYGWNRPITLRQSLGVAMLSLALFALFLMVLAVEGAICIVMAFPICAFLGWLGSMFGFQIIRKRHRTALPLITCLVLGIPLLSFYEKSLPVPLTSVVTSVDIDATPEVVWSQVLAFPQLDEPHELLFKSGIAYPVNAQIEGTGVGAVRHCNFTTGSFVEPITVWDQPRLLQFDVADQPAPMKELSFWDVNAPHLHDYFVSKKGRFLLRPLPNGKTRLEGTTWYYHRIRPVAYWGLWSNYIVHSIHMRVLQHIKKNAEAAQRG